MRVTIRDVAKQAGVSINTVSRVVNNHPDTNSFTKAKVEQVIQAMGYTPNHNARSLVSRQSRTVGLVVTDCTNPNTAQQIRAMQQVLTEAGYAAMIFDTQEDGKRQNTAMRVLDEHIVDGIILHPAEMSDEQVKQIAKRVPVVLINRTIDGFESDTVLNDNVDGAAMATAHLIANGHRRIAYLIANRAISTVRDRLAGYELALKAAAIEIDDRLVVRTAISAEAAMAATQQLLAQPNPPTAFFAYNDLMAVGVMAAVHEAGLRMPKDIALVGFDNIVYAPYLQVPLTTMAQQSQEMAKATAKLLLQRLAGDKAPPQHLRFKSKLIVRQSSGGPQ